MFHILKKIIIDCCRCSVTKKGLFLFAVIWFRFDQSYVYLHMICEPPWGYFQEKLYEKNMNWILDFLFESRKLLLLIKYALVQTKLKKYFVQKSIVWFFFMYRFISLYFIIASEIPSIFVYIRCAEIFYAVMAK